MDIYIYGLGYSYSRITYLEIVGKLKDQQFVDAWDCELLLLLFYNSKIKMARKPGKI